MIGERKKWLYMEIYNGTYCVYIHTNKVNGKMYVGQTCRKPKDRWQNGNGYKGCICFYNAIQKYGWDNFEHEIIASNLTKEEANNFEQILIKKIKTQSKEYGYNICDGGQVHNTMQGRTLSVEHRKKISESKIGEKNPMYGVRLCGEKNGMYGKHHSEEEKQRLREMFSGVNGPSYGKKMSEEIKNKISMAKKGKYSGENNPFYGKRHTEDAKEKIRNAAINRNDNKKPVVQLDDDGNLIKEWNSISHAWQTLGICRASIPNCLTGKQKHAGGYRWALASDYYK